MKKISVPNPPGFISQESIETALSARLKTLRKERRISLRSLANLSGLNVNTLSAIENGRSSPSVSTLQQLALALEVPISTFFETEKSDQKVVFTLAEHRPQATFSSILMQDLGQHFSNNVVQPFLLTIDTNSSSGDHMIVHTGYEFVYCLSGSILYQVEASEYNMKEGDSLLFEAQLPHCWKNQADKTTQILLVLIPTDERENVGRTHFRS